MAISLVQTDTFATRNNSTSATYNLCANVQAGRAVDDLVVVQIAMSNSAKDVTPPAGWTEVQTQDNNSTSIPELATFVYRYTGVSIPDGFGIGPYAHDLAVVVSVWRGVKLSPLVNVQASAAALNATATAPTVTTTQDGCVVLRTYTRHSTSAWTAPAGTTLLGTAANASSGCIVSAYETKAAQGATGTRDLALAPGNADNYWAAATVALAPGNAAPNAPTLTTMAAGDVVDQAAVNRAAHTFSDPDSGDSQSAFDHRYRLVGAATWTTAYASTPNGYVDYPAGTFAAGDYERQVRTYDAQGMVGPWSASGYFTAAAPPPTPTITAPVNGATIATPSATVTWSAPSQDGYQVQVKDGGVVEYDSGAATGTTRELVVPLPDNGVTRQIQVRVRANGLWSTWYSVTVSVSYTPPPAPVVALTATATTLQVQVTNPAPGVGVPAVVDNLVYVDDGDGETLRAHLAANGTWTYWTPRSGIDYATRVRVVAVGENGATA